MSDIELVMVPVNGSVETYTLKVGGETFRCEECKSNCFHKYDVKDPSAFECNGCGLRYRGE